MCSITPAITTKSGDGEMRDAYVDDDDVVIPDGGRVRVRMDMMDSMQRRIAQMFDARDHQPHFAEATDVAVRDARTAARDARNEYVRNLTTAYRTAGRVQDAAPHDDPAAAMRGHLQQPEPNNDLRLQRLQGPDQQGVAERGEPAPRGDARGPEMRPPVPLPDAARSKLNELQPARMAAEDVLEVLLWKGAA
jgi:hypothetical protein